MYFHVPVPLSSSEHVSDVMLSYQSGEHRGGEKCAGIAAHLYESRPSETSSRGSLVRVTLL